MKKNQRSLIQLILVFILQAAATIIILVVVYLAILTFPQPFFHYHLQAANLTLYSDRPIPHKPGASILAEVQRRLSRSEIYDAKVPYRIFICNDRTRFTFFANLNYRVGGVNYPIFNHNSFLRTSSIARDRLTGPSGHEVPGARTLTYFITHEVTHGVTAYAMARHGAYCGAFNYFSLPTWIQEGYADYVAFGNSAVGNNAVEKSAAGKASFDYQANLIKFRNGDREMAPQKSGLYLRYHLLVAFWLDIEHRTAAALLKEKPPQSEIEAEIRAFIIVLYSKQKPQNR
jgi:hypothetical protein